MVEVFREVRRVLHSTGVVWLNMGDSYCSDAGVIRQPTTLDGPRVPSGWTNRAQPMRVHAIRKKQDVDPAASGTLYKNIRPQDYLKPKDLCMMPARLAIALQQDGWYLRAQIPWIKANGMPESTTDRPVSSIEYIFMLTKSESYFYDREAVRMAASCDTHGRGNGLNPKACDPNSRFKKDRDPAHQTPAKISAKQNRSFSAAVNNRVATRARRTSDWFFSSIDSHAKGFAGLMVDDDGDPLAMLVNPQPFSVEMCEHCDTIYGQADYRKLPKVCTWPRVTSDCNNPEGKGEVSNGRKVALDSGRHLCVCGSTACVSHFATFPQRLVEPLILASTSAHGACEHCGSPYERVLENEAEIKSAPEKNTSGKWNTENSRDVRVGDNPHSFSKTTGAHERSGLPAPITAGWRATCDHPLFPCGVVPCRVLDPFSGSGRTWLAAAKHDRDYIGVELSRRYAAMSKWQYSEIYGEAHEPIYTPPPPQPVVVEENFSVFHEIGLNNTLLSV